MQEFLGIDKVLQGKGELVNSISKLTEIDIRIKKLAKSFKKLKMILLILENKGSYIEIERMCREDLLTQDAVAEHAWALTVFVAELIGVWLMQKVKK